jgi:virulence-associated protein VagC
MEEGLHFIAHVVVSVVLILTVGGVLVLRPITKRLSEALDLDGREPQSGPQEEIEQVRELVEAMMSTRLQLMEERQDFSERLFAAEERGGSDVQGEPPR